MTPAFEEILKRTFPTVFGKGLEWGFQCGNGWFPLLYKLAGGLEAHNLTLPEPQQIYAVQVKEKLGTLRFYIDGPDSDEGLLDAADLVYTWIQEAEDQAAITCELCGGQGRLVCDRMYLQTLCNECKYKTKCRRCSQYKNS